jgi:hypothetical protein
MKDDSRSRPDNGLGRPEHHHGQHRERHCTTFLPEEQPRCNRDLWIESYVSYLAREHERLGGGAIGRHYLTCVAASYREFQSAGTQQARFGTWLGIRTLCQWLAQLEGLAP